MTPPRTTKIVAVSGSGRTGSTLLSLLLTQDSGIFNLGQLRDLWGAWLADAPCTCGHGLRTCPVYAAVVASVLGAGAEQEMRALQRGLKAFFSDASRTADWNASRPLEKLARHHAPFLGRLGELLAALRTATQASAFVDASKSPEMALALSLVDGVDLRVLNLVRDPRAIAVSWQKRRGSLRAGWEFSRIWLRRQRRLRHWSKALGERFVEVRYEEFAADARSTVLHVQAWAGLEPTPAVFRTASEAIVSWDGQHLYPPANERVLKERATAVRIVPAEDWQDPRHRLQHRLALLATWPDGGRYVRSGRATSSR
jgi:hypothetical protein